MQPRPLLSGPALPTGVRRLSSLTSLRAFAAFAVFLLHIQARLGGAPLRVERPFGAQGLSGVTFFFVLSGFVLTWSARPNDTVTSFWWRRFARIYPAYLAALILGAVVTLADHQHIGLLPALSSVTLTQAWVPSGVYYFAVNGVSWSLSCEAFFYALFPLLMLALPRLALRGRRMLQVGLVILILAVTVAGSVRGGDPLSWFSGDWLAIRNPVSRLLDFMLGITAALDIRDGHWPVRLRVGPCVTVAAAAWLASGLWYTSFSNTAIPVVATLLLLTAVARHEASGGRSVLQARPLVWLGEVSYSFYLVHQLVIRAFSKVGEATSWPKAGVVFVGALGVSVLAAGLLHRIVEMPAERRLRRWYTQRAHQPAHQPAHRPA